jgi:hypothetical protein
MRKLLLLGLLFAARLTAQDAAPTLQVRIHILPHRGILTEDSVLQGVPSRLLYAEGDGFSSVSLQRNGTSETIRIPQGKPLVLHLPDVSGNPAAVVLEHSFPAEWSSALIVLDPDAESPEGRIAHEVFNTSAERLAVGSNLVRNELDHIVKFSVNGKEHSIDPGAEMSFVFAEPRVRFQVEEQSGKEHRVATGALHRSETCGMLHILRKNPRSTRRIDILTLQGPGE